MYNRSPGGYGGQRPPKTYDFISLPDSVIRQKVPGHNLLKHDLYTGTLEFVLRTLTPVFVSSGQPALSESLGMNQGGVIQAHYRIGDQIAIPGSSLKGAVRSVAEAVSASCLNITRASHRDLPDAFNIGCTTDAACTACILFGMSGRGREAYSGHVHFHDAVLQKGRTRLFRMPALFRPRPESSFYRKPSRKFKGRKFYKHYRPNEDRRGVESEAILPDSLLAGKIEFTNLTESQLGLVFYSMGCGTRIQLKLGGGKPKGLGSLETEPKRLILNSVPDSFLIGPDKSAISTYENAALIERIQRSIISTKQSKFFLNKQAEELEKLLHFNPDTLEDVPSEVIFRGGRQWR